MSTPSFFSAEAGNFQTVFGRLEQMNTDVFQCLTQIKNSYDGDSATGQVRARVGARATAG